MSTQKSEVKNVCSHSSTKVSPTANVQQLNQTTMYHGALLVFNQIPKYLKMENTGVTANLIVLEEVRKKIRMKIYILHDIYESVHLYYVLIIPLEYPCDEQQLFNIRGKCVAQAEERIRIARPYAHEFRSGLNDTTTVRKCSEEHPYGINVCFN